MIPQPSGPNKENCMRRALLGNATIVLFTAQTTTPPTADEIVSRYIQRVGGVQRIQAVQSLRRSGKFIGGGGFEAEVMQENKRPGMVRQEFIIQGMSGINAYDGKSGWKIDPFGG